MAISSASKRAWEREKQTLARIYKGITKRKTRIIDISPESDELGFTSGDGLIHLAHEHSVMDALDEAEKKFFRMGVFAHEMLHQIYSDFHILESVQRSLNPMEGKIYATLSNLIEDPAIEYMAPNVIGGSVLKALRFMIQTLYNQSPAIDQSPMGFSQYANALVLFGDMGIIKGHFTDGLAAEMFQKTCGLFNEAVENSNAKFRSDVALELMNETRPLWEVMKHQDLMDLLSGLKNHDAESGSGGGSVISLPAMAGRMPLESDSKSEARKKIVSELEKEEPPASGKETEEKASGSGDGRDDGNGPCDSFSFEGDKLPDEEDQPTGLPEPGAECVSEDGFELDVPDAGNDDCIESELNSMDEVNAALDECGKESEAGDDAQMRESRRIVEIDEGDISWMRQADEISEKELKKQALEMSGNEETKIDESIEPIIYPKGKFHMENNDVSIAESAMADYAGSYSELIGRYAASISAFVKRMKRIFSMDCAKREYKKSGKVSIKRYAGARKTARIFERRTAPKGICDIAVAILVDESGSMEYFDSEGEKFRYQIAQECAIALAETFSRLGIPVYVLGFSADEHGYSAEHYHYVKWSNSLNERYKLLQIRARGNNFDSLSISYASEILKRKRAMHKILIVISDGVPACESVSMKQGFADTKEAIRQARRDMDVLGIAIGNDCTKEIQYLYGRNFLHVTDVNAAFADISKGISGIVRAW